MFAMPHHVASFDNTTRGSVKGLKLATTTEGMATAVLAQSWTMLEPDLQVDMDFASYIPKKGSVTTLRSASAAALHAIASAEAAEYQQSSSVVLNSLLNEPTMYFGGKKAHRLARIVYTIHDILVIPVSLRRFWLFCKMPSNYSYTTNSPRLSCTTTRSKG